MNYIVFDCETGGIAKETSLLTVWFGVYDKKFNLVNSLDLKVKPDSGLYVIEPEALEINKIDLVRHNKTAISYKEAKSVLYSFLQKSYATMGMLTPVGHNVNFDIAKVTDNLISLGSWESFVSYRVLDTGVIANFLRIAGLLPENLDAGLSKLVDYYNVKVEGTPHEAEYDAKATFEVFKRLLDDLKVRQDF